MSRIRAFVIPAAIAGAWGMLGYSCGSDARLCATGPSPEEETMRAMHDQCGAKSGVWRWYFDKQNLEMDATCIGGE